MKTKNLFPCLGEALVRSWVLPALIAALNLLSVGQAPAQTFTSLDNFHGSFDNPIFLGNPYMPLFTDWFYRATPFMERRVKAAVRALARCSPSEPMARVLRTCIVSLA